jgi:hypothetical protein
VNQGVEYRRFVPAETDLLAAVSFGVDATFMQLEVHGWDIHAVW